MAKHTIFEPAVIDAIKRDEKVTAIKLLRQLKNIGLKEAKELVDQYCAEHDLDAPQYASYESHSRSKMQPSNMGLEFEQPVIDAVNRGKKIQAIKILRESRRIGLKEAKELVDEYCAVNHVKAQAAGESNFLSYVAGVIVIGLIGYFAVKFFG